MKLHLRMLLLALLTLAGATLATTAEAKERLLWLPEGALVRFHFNNNAVDSVNATQLKAVERKKGSPEEAGFKKQLLPVGELKYDSLNGGLCVHDFYVIDRDFSPKKYPQRTYVLKLAAFDPKFVDIHGPLYPYSPKSGKLGKYGIFESWGWQSVALRGHEDSLTAVNSAKEGHYSMYNGATYHSQKKHATHSNEDGQFVYIVMVDGIKATVRASNVNLTVYHSWLTDNNFDRLMLVPSDYSSVTDFAFYDRLLTEEEITRMLDSVEPPYKMQVMDYVSLVITVLNIFLCFVMHRRRREFRATHPELAKFKWDANKYVVFAIVVSLGMYAFIYSRHFDVFKTCIVINLVLYFYMAKRALSHDQIAAQKLFKRIKSLGLTGKAVDLGVAGVEQLFKEIESHTYAAKLYKVDRNGNRTFVKDTVGFDSMGFLGSMMAYLFVVAIIGTIAIFLMNLVVLLACLVPSVCFCIYGMDMEKMFNDDFFD